MRTINAITKENFHSMFNIIDILEGSVFYPGSGVDGKDIKFLTDKYCSFIHVDYSASRYEVETAMRNDFERVGYDLIGLKRVRIKELTPMGFIPRATELNEHEQARINDFDFIRDRFYGENFTPFALWAVYELNPLKTGKTKGKISRFSLLHIGEEACATFEAIYVSNKINPKCVVILNPSEGYGDNWTLFTNPEFRLYQSILHNTNENNAELPDELLTNCSLWPDYCFQEEDLTDPSTQILFTHKNYIQRISRIDGTMRWYYGRT